MATVIEHVFKPRGAVRQLWDTFADEVLVEGPAGTGKTRGDLEWVFAQCEMYPEIRVLFMRDTRKSMNDTILATWELEVVPPGHPILVGPKKEHRDTYQWPDHDNGKRGALIVLGSMEHIERVLSGFYDIIVLFEAKEVKRIEKYELLLTRLRSFRHPKVQMMLVETNPGAPSHWINTRANAGKMVRLYSRHEDNPTYFDPDTGEPTERGKKYLGVLSRLSGARRANYYLGKWQSEEGAVWENYDAAVHEVYPPERNKKSISAVDQYDFSSWGIQAWYGSMDFGWTKPGCFQLWGVRNGLDGFKVAFRVCEIYYTKRQMDWWADRICDLYREFKMTTIWADGAEPRSIDLLNDRLGSMMDRDAPRIVMAADKDVRVGIDTVTWALGNQDVPGQESDPVRMYFMKDAHWFGIDQDLVNNALPTGFASEIDSYVYPKLEDGKVYKDAPDPKCEDHACNCVSYFSVGVWDYSLPTPKAAPMFKKGSVGAVLGWNDVIDPPKKWRPGQRSWKGPRR